MCKGRGPFRARVAAIALAVPELCIVPLSSLVAGIASTQSAKATIRRQVIGPPGALVLDAEVMAVNKNTGVKVLRGNNDSAVAFVALQLIRDPAR